MPAGKRINNLKHIHNERKTLRNIAAALLFTLSGIIATTEQDHAWQTLVGVAMIAATAVMMGRHDDDEPEKYPEE